MERCLPLKTYMLYDLVVDGVGCSLISGSSGLSCFLLFILSFFLFLASLMWCAGEFDFVLGVIIFSAALLILLLFFVIFRHRFSCWLYCGFMLGSCLALPNLIDYIGF